MLLSVRGTASLGRGALRSDEFHGSVQVQCPDRDMARSMAPPGYRPEIEARLCRLRPVVDPAAAIGAANWGDIATSWTNTKCRVQMLLYSLYSVHSTYYTVTSRASA